MAIVPLSFRILACPQLAKGELAKLRLRVIYISSVSPAVNG